MSWGNGFRVYVLLADGSIFHSLCCTAYSIHIHKYHFPIIFVTGMFIWTLLEYIIHRFIFHMKPANNYYLITLHFMLHGQHHKVRVEGQLDIVPL